MSTTTNPRSVLFQLRQLTPRRPLSHGEALRIAELQANRLLEAAGIDSPGTPSELIAGLPFVEVVLRDDLPVSGLTDWYKPRWLILLNGLEPEVRRRFSLMHEFKHILDHPYIDFLYPGTWSNDSERRGELVADYFAACLLMPKRLVKRSFGQGHQQLTELAAEFGVSTVAMNFRLQQLGLLERVQRCERHYRPTGHHKGYFRRSSTLTAAA
jgi:hypothetical protein